MKLSRFVLPGLMLGAAAAAFVGPHAPSTAAAPVSAPTPAVTAAARTVPVPAAAVKLSGCFYETAQGRVPVTGVPQASGAGASGAVTKVTMPDGRVVTIRGLAGAGTASTFKVSAEPTAGILKWGVAIEAAADEYFTGVMERTVDGPQKASWAPGIKEAMNLRGQRVAMIVKPTTSVYAPFFLSSRGYGVLVRTDWPGIFDFCAADPAKVQLEFEGPALELQVYIGATPAEIVRAHALDAGPPFLPPKWAFSPWRWRDEHTQRTTYYDGTPVTGPFNSELMEDALLMRAFGIPCGVYWIDRPWGPGPLGYDDFTIDAMRLPNFAESVRWLNEQGTQMLLWIGPFFQGRMEEEALAKGWNLAGQERLGNGNNYPLADFTNPAARRFWQDGVARLLKLGVAGFKLDRGEEAIPDDGPFRCFGGQTIRQNRNTYVVRYAKAAYDVAKQYRGDDFVLMSRGAYTGSSPHAVFWGGDIGGTNEGLRASIIAVQRAAVMGYPNWGSDTTGYSDVTLEHDLCLRWLAFSCFTPIMEVGPTKNVGFWDLPREPRYDTSAIAAWRLYARLHQRLAEYGYACAQEASRTGMPIVRPLFLVDPAAAAAWTNWWTFCYGSDLLVSPIWQKGQTKQDVYLPSGARWRDAWNPDKVYGGGQTITVEAAVYQIPLLIREGSFPPVGDLNREWQDSLEIATAKPDLKPLDAAVRAWFEAHRKAAARL